jgi:uncharacterized RDD family membrane protein YckC
LELKKQFLSGKKFMYHQDYPSVHQSTTDLFAEEPLVYGGFWERFAAAFIDGLIVGVANMILSFIFPFFSLFGIITAWLYHALQESGNSQATIGKKALGLKVVNENGQQISFGQATGRHFGKYLSGIILFIGYLMMLWDEKKQTLHDKMANTYVVKS